VNALRILRHRDAALALIVLGLILAIGLRAPVFVTPDPMLVRAHRHKLSV